MNPQLIEALRAQRAGVGQAGPGGMAGAPQAPVGASPMMVAPPQAPPQASMGPGQGANPLMSKLGQVLAKRQQGGSPGGFGQLGGQVGPMGNSGLQPPKPNIGGTVGGLAGGALGTAMGGPVGGALGGMAGNALGGMMGNGGGVWDSLSDGVKSLFRF